MRFASRHLAVISSRDGAADAGTHAKGGGGSGVHLHPLKYLVTTLALLRLLRTASRLLRRSPPQAQMGRMNAFS